MRTGQSLKTFLIAGGQKQLNKPFFCCVLLLLQFQRRNVTGTIYPKAEKCRGDTKVPAYL